MKTLLQNKPIFVMALLVIASTVLLFTRNQTRAESKAPTMMFVDMLFLQLGVAAWRCRLTKCE